MFPKLLMTGFDPVVGKGGCAQSRTHALTGLPSPLQGMRKLFDRMQFLLSVGLGAGFSREAGVKRIETAVLCIICFGCFSGVEGVPALSTALLYG